MQKYTGHPGRQYESQAEAAASLRFAQHGCIPANEKLPQTFTDSEGTEFRAKADFYHPGSGLFIEFKSGKLNGCKTKNSADKQLARKEDYRHRRGQPLVMKDRLDFQWNHARRKHAIVQAKLTPQNFIVVFDKPPTIGEAVNYLKAGIVFVPLSHLCSFLLYARLAKAGVKTSFLLRYNVEEVGPMILALGPYELADLA